MGQALSDDWGEVVIDKQPPAPPTIPTSPPLEEPKAIVLTETSTASPLLLQETIDQCYLNQLDAQKQITVSMRAKRKALDKLADLVVETGHNVGNFTYKGSMFQIGRTERVSIKTTIDDDKVKILMYSLSAADQSIVGAAMTGKARIVFSMNDWAKLTPAARDLITRTLDVTIRNGEWVIKPLAPTSK